MYTDVVGYSKLTGDNQQVALIILEEHNKILEQSTQKYSGNIVKLTGDGLCALFDNPIDGIKCSIEIQKSLNKRNKLNIDERKIEIRIGLHYGTYELKDNDVFGDGINLAKKIEPVAPHSGIAISPDLNNMIWNTNDIYIREYIKLEFDNKTIQLYEVYLDLITWCINSKKQSLQKINSNEVYIKAHKLFHQGDYSSAIKFAFLALSNSNKKNSTDILSFICHTFISLGNIKYANTIIKQIEIDINKNANPEQNAHLYKMKGNLEYNLGNRDNALNFFDKSFTLMIKSNEKYVNEIIYYLSTILLEKKEYHLIPNYLEKIIHNNDSYSKILYGVKLFLLNKIDDKKINNFKNEINNINNKYLSSLAFMVLAKIYFKNKDIDNSKESINHSKALIIKSSENISDESLRDNFLNNILINKEITNFLDKISDHYLDLTFKKIEQSEDINKKITNVHNFCTECGTENKNTYNFCINCGNDLQIKSD